MAKRHWTQEEIEKQVQAKPTHGRFKDLEGRIVGRITVGRYCGQSKYRESLWECWCKCGSHYICGSIILNNPKIQSCGCYHAETAGQSSVTHGMRRSTEYGIWAGIKKRCFNKKCRAYKDYGGRGITMCQEWVNSFEEFYGAVGKRPAPDMEIDRYPNNNGNYEPGNVRWATKKEQANNRRSSRLITIGNDTKTLSQWGESTGLGCGVIRARIANGWSQEDAVLTPLHGKPKEQHKHGEPTSICRLPPI